MPAEAGIPAAERPMQRMSLHDEIVERLRNMILDGLLAPGQPIPELKLCEDLQISRTPLREALKVLAAEEFVTLLPNRGSVVRDIVPEEIAEVFEVMEGFETLIGELVIARASEADIGELREMHAQLVAFKQAGDKHAYFDTNQAIHRRLAELTGNRVLATGYAAYADKIRRARYLANQTNARWGESVDEHEAFMQALERRDVKLFSQLLREHMRRTGEAVVAALHELPKTEIVAGRRSRK